MGPNIRRSAVHFPRTQQSNFSKTNALPKRHEHYAVIGTSDNLDSPDCNDKHLFANVALLANVVSGQEQHRLQLDHEGLQKAWIASMEQLHPAYCLRKYIGKLFNKIESFHFVYTPNLRIYYPCCDSLYLSIICNKI